MTQQIIPQSSSIGSTIDESSFSGLLTLVKIGHIHIRLAGNGRINRIGLLAEPPGVIARRENDRHTVMDVGDQLVAIGGDDSKGPNPFARSRWPFYRPGGCFEKRRCPSTGRGGASVLQPTTYSPIGYRVKQYAGKSLKFHRDNARNLSLFAPENAISA